MSETETENKIHPLRTILFSSGAFGFDIFFGLIIELAPPYLVKLNIPDSMVNAMWISLPIIAFIIGLLPLYLSRQEKREIQSRKRAWFSIISMMAVVIFVMLFSYIPRMFQIEGTQENDRASKFTMGLFFGLVLAINCYMQTFFVMSTEYTKSAVISGSLPAWSAIGQVAAMIIILRVDQPLDHMGKVCGIASVCIFIVTFISLYAAYGTSLSDFFKLFRCKCSETSEEDDSPLLKNIDSSKEKEGSCQRACSSIPSGFRYVVSTLKFYFKEGTWIVCIFAIFIWMSMYSFLPISTDWFAVVIGNTTLHTPEYEAKAVAASLPRLYQQLVQLAGSFLTVCISTCLESRSRSATSSAHSSDKNVWIKPTFYTNWSIGVLAIASYTGFMFMAGIVLNETLATVAFAMTGLGGVCIYSVRALQDSFLAFKRGTLEDEKQVESIPTDRKSEEVSLTYSSLNRAYYTYYKVAVCFGQFIVLSFSQKAVKTIGYQKLILLSGGFSGVALLVLLFFPCSPTCIKSSNSHTNEEKLVSLRNTLFRRNIIQGKPKVVFMTTSKKHAL